MDNSITFLISTLNEGIDKIKLPPIKDNVQYIIVHQVVNGFQKRDIPLILKRIDVKYVIDLGTGLTRSRNIALSNVSTKYSYILDDDVEIKIDTIDDILKAFKETKSDLIAFNVETFEGKPFKKYSKVKVKINKILAARVSSIEIAFVTKSLLNKGIKFDEDFGLGGKYPSGEEYIFITDCLKAGLSVLSYPLTTVKHEAVSSGQDFFSNELKIIAKKKMFERITGKKISFIQIAFFMKKFKILMVNKKLRYFFCEYFRL
ncbi:glycosyltransferase [Aliivibrio fischeri]|uniref:glycosyltransferase n=1 Tax=Aliivibrio fischeri TaxID=668 RepID=UPI001F476034|nr:glycosyltransferase [Aliivibrio fischeri]MCE7566322.1 glycosyltransferase [Aliivibrio fischeri]